MPLVRISLMEGKSADFRRGVGDAVHTAMVETMNVPALDRFQVISEHTKDSLIYDPTYLDIQRTDDIIIVQITLNEGRTVELKRAFYKRVADLLKEKLNVRSEDVLISLVEVKKENWSFGNGIAQYAQG
jgi:4-oxalocrotonate tautomerase